MDLFSSMPLLLRLEIPSNEQLLVVICDTGPGKSMEREAAAAAAAGRTTKTTTLDLLCQ